MSATLGIELPLGLPGLTKHVRFELTPRSEGSAYAWLRCVDEPSLELLTVDILQLHADYPVEQVRRGLGFLHLDPDESLMVLALCTVPKAPEPATANLLTPVGIGTRSRRAAQIVLHDARWSDRTPLPTGAG